MSTRDQFLPAIDQWATRHIHTFNLLFKRGPDGGLSKIRAAGFRKALQWIYQEVRGSICIFFSHRWDRKHKVDTSGKIPISSLDVLGPNRELAHHAISTPVSVFNYLSRFFPTNTADHVYIDMGCGKGRTLVLASKMGFGWVTGVEFAPKLCAVARTNIASRMSSGQPVQNSFVVEADATQYELPKEKLVLYFCNPFYAELWPAMIENILQSYRKHPRHICIVLAGSALPETLRQTSARFTSTGIFQRAASGVTPYFIDSYLPYHYEVLESYLV